MSMQTLIEEACARRLGGMTKLSRDKMRLSGYPGTMSKIDIAEGLDGPS
jgi:hypothetical protein